MGMRKELTMALTPDEILNHEFTRKGSKAYLAKEVDTFLDSVNNDYRELIARYDHLSATNEQLETRVKQLESQREEVNQSIIFAQEMANKVRREAEEESQKQVSQAREAATQIIDDARGKADVEAKRLAQENVDLINEQNRLRGEVIKFRDSFASLLTQQKNLLESQQLDAAVSLLPTSQISVNALEASPVEPPVVNTVETVNMASADVVPEPGDVPAVEASGDTAQPSDKQDDDPTLVVFPDNP